MKQQGKTFKEVMRDQETVDAPTKAWWKTQAMVVLGPFRIPPKDKPE